VAMSSALMTLCNFYAFLQRVSSNTFLFQISFLPRSRCRMNNQLENFMSGLFPKSNKRMRPLITHPFRYQAIEYFALHHTVHPEILAPNLCIEYLSVITFVWQRTPLSSPNLCYTGSVVKRIIA